MAFLAQDPNQVDPQKQQQQGQGAPGQTTSIGGTSTIGGGGPSASTPAAGGAASTSGGPGQFTNLQNYVTANQGNDAQMGQAVTGTVGGQAQAADQAGQQFQTAAKTTVDKNTVTEDPSLVGGLQAAAKGGSAPTIDKSEFGREYGANYTAPTDATGFDNYAGTRQNYANVQDLGKKAVSGDTSQRGQLLQQTYGQNGQQYNQGQQLLDSFVLGAGDQGAKSLQNIGNQYGGYLDNQFKGLTGMVNGYAQQGKQTTDQTRQDVQNAASGAYGSIEGRLGSAADQARVANDQLGKQAAALGSGDAAALKSAGLSDAAIQYLKDSHANYGNYVAPGGSSYNVGNFADKNDVGNYQNLFNLIKGVGGAATNKYAGQLDAANVATPALKQEDVAAANQLAALNSTLGSTLAARQAQNDTAYNRLHGLLANLAPSGLTFASTSPAQIQDTAAKLGVSADELAAAQSFGFDPTSYLTQGPKLGLGDVASNDQRGQFSQLSKLLGLSDVGASTGANPGFGFDKNGFEANLAAWEAAHPAPPPAPGPGPVNNDPGSGKWATNVTRPLAATAQRPKQALNSVINDTKNDAAKLDPSQIVRL